MTLRAGLPLGSREKLRLYIDYAHLSLFTAASVTESPSRVHERVLTNRPEA
jgi:hypothetical protein